ncbi:MAG: DUF6507 family protein [Propionibacteriaceae bacterium]
MTRWDIDYAEALGVVGRAAGKAEGYQKNFTGVEDAATGLNGVLTHSQLVQSALNSFATEVAAPQLTTVAGHTDSAIRGTATAIHAYQAGQAQMAAEAQKNAAKADYPKDMPGGSRSTGANGPGNQAEQPKKRGR